MSFWDEWFKRFGKRSSFFGEFDRMMREMENEMANIIREMESDMPENMTREIRNSNGSTRREYGPFVYGYSVRIGPDGKPVIREFGNMKPGLETDVSSPLSLQDRREPLVDVIEDNNTIKVLAELPGVEKKDIKIQATTRGLTITVDNMDRRYYKELEFNDEIDRSSAKSSYRNGVLEISFKKKHEDSGTTISIE
ncbi:archaeal heat shock protein Hsp20 [Thermoproteota archaeon]